jgi:hypothetical protein
MAESPDIDEVGLEELKSLLLQVLEDNARRKAEAAALRDENARLKGLKGRPQIKPSGMEKAAGLAAKSKRTIGRHGSKRAKLTIDETTIIRASIGPTGARLKGYEDFIVQDLVVETRTTLYRREQWRRTSGETIVAPLPVGITSHPKAEPSSTADPGLKRFVLAQYHQDQSTMPRLAALLQGLGLNNSKRQLVRLHIAGQDAFLAEAREVLRTRSQAASPAAALPHLGITVDDTGARHKAQNGVCTQLGNDIRRGKAAADFTSFVTTGSKSRLNFLDVLNAGCTTHLVNDAALAYMREHDLATR